MSKIYKYDNGVEFNKDWSGYVDKKNFLYWWKDFSSYNIHNYEYYLVGSFINKTQARDVDLIVTGDIKEDLSYILSLARIKGAENKIMIDVKYQNKIDEYPFFTIKNYYKRDTYRNEEFCKSSIWGGYHWKEDLYRKDYDSIDQIKKHPHLKRNLTNKVKKIKIQDYIDGN